MLWKTAKASNWKVHIQNQLQESKSPFLTYTTQKSPTWEAIRSQLVKEFPAFYGTRRSIIAFASVHHPYLSWARSIQSIPPYPTSCRFMFHSEHTYFWSLDGFFRSEESCSFFCGERFDVGLLVSILVRYVMYRHWVSERRVNLTQVYR